MTIHPKKKENCVSEGRKTTPCVAVVMTGRLISLGISGTP
jgi:hypothetical protein